MPYLDTYQGPLDTVRATHLLRRTTFGPTKSEIDAFVGTSATEAVDRLITNVARTISPPPPVDFDDTSVNTFGQSFLNLPFSKPRLSIYTRYVSYWWTGLMAQQSGYPSILEKLAAFWQNHFVVSSSVVQDYRYMYRYINTIRAHSLGDFKSLAIEITKDPAMLIFQNGNENQKANPNENYARELQELFVVGVKDYYGQPNYTEDDVKAAARVLTGWQASNYQIDKSTSFSAVFSMDRHDPTNKVFSSYYKNAILTGRTGADAGNVEIEQLMSMLLAHPESPKYICRKLYRWFVNNSVPQNIEDNVIIPLANLFASPANGFKIEPVVRTLLSSQIFYDQSNFGAIIKSPAEWMIGLLRYFNQPVPDITNDYVAFSKYGRFIYDQLATLQYGILDQPSVFGYPPFYQTGYSDNWINGAALGARNLISNRFVFPHVSIKPGYTIGIDFIGWVTSLQPNFADVINTPSVATETVLDAFTKHLFAFELSANQKNFLIDTIMMRGLSRQNWIREWDAYRVDPTNKVKKDTVRWRCESLMRYLLRMAEYHMC